MTKAKPVDTQREEEEVIAEVVPEEQSQVTVRESMDVDPRTGARVHIGVPERDDAEEVQDFITWLQSMADSESKDVVARIAENLRRASTAESIADLLRETPTASGKDIVGEPFWALKLTINEGDFEDEELKFFASIDARHPQTSEHLIVNCGGENILVYLKWMMENMDWPIYMCFTGKQTRKGRTILSIDVLEPPQ